MESPPESPVARRWRRAAARVCAQQAVVTALEPEAAWRQLRPYAALLAGGVLFAPISQAVLLTAVGVSCGGEVAGDSALLQQLPCRWWLPLPWWRSLLAVLGRLWQSGGPWRLLRSTSLFALHDAATRGRLRWVEEATDIGAVRPARPLLRCVALEALCGTVGVSLTLEYMRGAIGGVGCASWQLLTLGTAAGAARGLVLATGGQRPALQSACGWLDFFLEVAAEREGARLLGYRCPLARYLTVVVCGIVSFLPWGLMIVPCNRAVVSLFGRDPIVEQKVVLEQVAQDLQQSERGHAELASARQRSTDFVGNVELASLWRRVRITRDACKLMRSVSLIGRERAQRSLATLLHELASARAQDLQEHLREAGGKTSLGHVSAVLQSSMAPIIVRRHGDLVRAGLTQIAERSVENLLLGITAQLVPGLQDDSVLQMLGLRVEFVGEQGLDMGGVRRDFMDCFATALARREPSRLTLVEPLRLLGLGADSTWRPVPCDKEHRGFLWALGRLLALAMVYRSPCPVQLSSLVFKCILGTTLRPGDVKQLDPDFWRHRVKPLLQPGGVELRQQELQSWGMDPLTFVSADGARELCVSGIARLVTEDNKEEYAQLLCEDFLIGRVRAEIGCLVTGFHEVVPRHLLRELDAEQLRMLVCGVAEIDVDEWQAHAQVEGCQAVAGWFFAWLRKQPREARSKVLAFATGSSVLPTGWAGLRDQQGRPLPFRLCVQAEPDALPSAHTCANLLVLPRSRSQAALERKLDQVVELAGREMLIC